MTTTRSQAIQTKSPRGDRPPKGPRSRKNGPHPSPEEVAEKARLAAIRLKKKREKARRKALMRQAEMDEENCGKNRKRQTMVESAEGPAQRKDALNRKLMGTFELYATTLAPLKSVYVNPADGSAVNPEGLYDEIHKLLANNDRSARVTIPEDYDAFTDSPKGSLHAAAYADLFSDAPFTIRVHNFTGARKNSQFRSEFRAPGVGKYKGGAIRGSMEVANAKDVVAFSAGAFVMQPLWRAIGEDGTWKELFEGHFTLGGKYTDSATKLGQGSGFGAKVCFWGVRATDVKQSLTDSIH